MQPSIRTRNGFEGLAPPFGVASHCPIHCRPRVTQRIQGIRTCRRPHLPLAYRQRSLMSAPTELDSNMRYGSCSLRHLRRHLYRNMALYDMKASSSHGTNFIVPRGHLIEYFLSGQKMLKHHHLIFQGQMHLHFYIFLFYLKYQRRAIAFDQILYFQVSRMLF